MATKLNSENGSIAGELALLSHDSAVIAGVQGMLGQSGRAQAFRDLECLRQFLHKRRSDRISVLLDLDSIPEGTRSWNNALPADTRILVLCAEREIVRVRLYLELGACDFLLKPLRKEELLFRLRLLEEPVVREKVTTKNLLSVFEPRLTQTELRILRVFLATASWTATREELMQQIWDNAYIQANALDVHLFNLRKKIRGSGYRIVAQGKMRRWKFEKEELLKMDHHLDANTDQPGDLRNCQ